MKSWTTLALIPVLSLGLLTTDHRAPVPDVAGPYTAFGLIHTPLASAALSAQQGALEILTDGNVGGVAVALDGEAVTNLYLDGISLPDGATFKTLVRAPGGDAVVLIEHQQTGLDRTELLGDFRAIAATSSSVRVRTFVGASLTHEWTGPTDEPIALGAVTSGAAWAKSVHVVCSEGDCSVVYDPAPAETFVFADGTSALFNYLVFTFEDVDPTLFTSSLELLSEGLDRFEITRADHLPMPW